jgi:pimeloyl-ACP methyl ester carboxylesterase
MRPFAHLGLVRFRPLLRVLGNPDNLDRALLKGMSAAALENLPRATVRQAREWLREREFVDETGARWLDGAEHVEVPLLVLGGQDDRIAAEPDVAHACRLFPTCEYRALAKLNGFSIDYGHIDTVVGRSAPAEIYPLIIRFLDRHRATIETRPH